ncbi:MAG: hypothetical protein M3T49_03100 [Candidatus Eremiobacteraeota bacterium]|nr:hypothetical protein [Candidatus Eremiobacteraeota bacterium]
MNKLALYSCAAILSASAVAQAAYAGVIVGSNQRIPIYTTLPARGVDTRILDFQAATSATVPFFRSTITSPLDHKTYPFEMVGTNPMTNKVSTTVKYVPLLLRVHFADGTVLDPTKPGCNDTVSVSQRFYGSPLFKATPQVSNGVAVGTTQVTDAYKRAEFWTYVRGSNYHVLLAAAANPRLIDVAAPPGSLTGPGGCAGSGHNLGQIDINAWDTIVQQLNNKYATPSQLPIVAAYNVVQTQGGGCCIIGYHSAYSRTGGTQTYAVGAYVDPGEFQSAGLRDIHAWSHEIGEWMDDPFIDDGTPAWGHVGQVSGCQNNLENGDPLTGTAYIDKLNGFTYHPQELVFFSWFYRTPSIGTGGEYSYKGTFETAQGACH